MHHERHARGPRAGPDRPDVEVDHAFKTPTLDYIGGTAPYFHDGSALTYIANRGGASNIWLQPLDGSAPRQLTDFKSDRIYAFDWSRDGKWLALSRGPEQRDVVIMSDFK